jgi:hypothetical protein
MNDQWHPIQQQIGNGLGLPKISITRTEKNTKKYIGIHRIGSPTEAIANPHHRSIQPVLS